MEERKTRPRPRKSRRKVFEPQAITKPAKIIGKGHVDIVSQDMTIYEQ